jgi:hypothetical protein
MNGFWLGSGGGVASPEGVSVFVEALSVEASTLGGDELFPIFFLWNRLSVCPKEGVGNVHPITLLGTVSNTFDTLRNLFARRSTHPLCGLREKHRLCREVCAAAATLGAAIGSRALAAARPG